MSDQLDETNEAQRDGEAAAQRFLDQLPSIVGGTAPGDPIPTVPTLTDAKCVLTPSDLAALIQRAETAQQALRALVEAVQDARPSLAASAEVSHFTDGLNIGADGMPGSGSVVKLTTAADVVLHRVDVALAQALAACGGDQ